MYHDNHNIAIFKFGRPHIVQPVVRSKNWNFPLNCEGRISAPQCSVFKMAAGAHHEANLMNFVQESAEKDEIKPKSVQIMTDIARLP